MARGQSPDRITRLIGATESLQDITIRYIRKVYHNAVFYQLR